MSAILIIKGLFTSAGLIVKTVSSFFGWLKNLKESKRRGKKIDVVRRADDFLDD